MKVLHLCLALLIQSKTSTASCGASNFEFCEGVQPCEDPFNPVSPTCFESCVDDDDCVEGERCRTLGVCGDNVRGATPCTFGCDACVDDGDETDFVCLCYERCPRVNGEFPSCSASRRSQCIGEEFTNPDIPDDPIADSFSCLSAYSQVDVLDKGSTYLKDVEQGDKVLVSSVTDSSLDVYQEVYGFGHRDVYAVATFLQIKTSGDQESPLEITGEHLVMKQSSPSGNFSPVRADSIEVGDVLIGSQGAGAKVIQIATIKRPGLYSPLTKNGNVLVNGVQVSAYTAVQDKDPESFTVGDLEVVSHHSLSHAALAPFRVMCLSVGFAYICEQRNEKGQLLFVNEGESLSSWIMTQTYEVQMMTLSVLIPCIMHVYYMEQLLGHFMAVCLFPFIGLVAIRFFCRSFSQNKSICIEKS